MAPDPVDIPLTERILTRIRRTKTDADELVAAHGGVDRAAGLLTGLYAQALDDIGGWCLDANGERQIRGGLHADDTAPWRGALTEHPTPAQMANETANTAFPECPECGAPPGQAHDPTCTWRPG